MSSQQSFEEVQQPRRLALFAGVFIAGMVGGAAVSGTFAHTPQARHMAPLVQVGAVTTFDVASVASDPSVPDAGTVLRHKRHERPEAAAPTF
jgi:hypothetical protein